MAALHADALRKMLRNLYWRGPTALRERIEDALDPAEAKSKQQAQNDVDGEALSDNVVRFVTLARSGAYIGGTREVHAPMICLNPIEATPKQIVDTAGQPLPQTEVSIRSPER